MPATTTADDLEAMTKDELHELAADRGIEVRASDTKAELIDAIEAADSPADPGSTTADAPDTSGAATVTDEGQKIVDGLVVVGAADPVASEPQGADVVDELPDQDVTDPGPRDSWPEVTLAKGLTVEEAMPYMEDGPEGGSNTDAEDAVSVLPNPEPGTDHAEVWQDPETLQWGYGEVAADGTRITWTSRGAFHNMTSARKAAQKKVGPDIPVLIVRIAPKA